MDENKNQKLIDSLVEIQEDSGYKPGWVVVQLIEYHDPTYFSLDDWKYLAEKLDYTSGWAYHRWQEWKKTG